MSMDAEPNPSRRRKKGGRRKHRKLHGAAADAHARKLRGGASRRGHKRGRRKHRNPGAAPESNPSSLAKRVTRLEHFARGTSQWIEATANPIRAAIGLGPLSAHERAALPHFGGHGGGTRALPSGRRKKR
jgi:hypothetical protein